MLYGLNTIHFVQNIPLYSIKYHLYPTVTVLIVFSGIPHSPRHGLPTKLRILNKLALFAFPFVVSVNPQTGVCSCNVNLIKCAFNIKTLGLLCNNTSVSEQKVHHSTLDFPMSTSPLIRK